MLVDEWRGCSHSGWVGKKIILDEVVVRGKLVKLFGKGGIQWLKSVA